MIEPIRPWVLWFGSSQRIYDYSVMVNGVGGVMLGDAEPAEAPYMAAGFGFHQALWMAKDSGEKYPGLVACGDNLKVVRQLRGFDRIEDLKLLPLHDRCLVLMMELEDLGPFALTCFVQDSRKEERMT